MTMSTALLVPDVWVHETATGVRLACFDEALAAPPPSLPSIVPSLLSPDGIRRALLEHYTSPPVPSSDVPPPWHTLPPLEAPTPLPSPYEVEVPVDFATVSLLGDPPPPTPWRVLSRAPRRDRAPEALTRSLLDAGAPPALAAALPTQDARAVELAREAGTGAWLAEYRSGAGAPSRAPGMSRTLFGDAAGPLQEAEARRASAEQAAAAPLRAAPVPAVADILEGVWVGDALERAEEEGEEEATAGAGEEAIAEAEAANLEEPKTLAPVGISSLPPLTDEGLSELLGGDSPAWVRESSRLLLPGASEAAAAAAPADPSRWARRASIPDLAARWREAAPRLARRYAFELDSFQKEAVLLMEQGQSVFVAAHTSAGKTAVAEYALALATRNCTRAVYTAPIKAISNQKFRDLGADFQVGLLTGDVQVRPEAPCLIMTTEILRSMLYRGADAVRDVEWVIFDEVHYVNDAERGVVWEEVIILLPPRVKLLFLSATVPNVMEFAEWVGRTKRRTVQVTGTLKRPVPLEHRLFYERRFFPLADGAGYRPEGYRAAKALQAERRAAENARAAAGSGGVSASGGGKPPAPGGGKPLAPGSRPPPSSAPRGGPPSRVHRSKGLVQAGWEGGRRAERQSDPEKAHWLSLIQSLRSQQLLPCILFCFSRRRCDALAEAFESLDLTTQKEKAAVRLACDRAFARLRGSDRRLPQVLRVSALLERGVGVHHAGLLPIVKEAVELVFCRGLIRVLAATETFAMGVNAPAKTVVFSELRKHDGESFRGLLPGEYTQMAGRAGRRGLDATGVVVLSARGDLLPPEPELRTLLTGAPTRLESQFRLTYSMILNLLRIDSLSVEDMLRRSFAEARAARGAPELLRCFEEGRGVLRALRKRPWPPSEAGRRSVAPHGRGRGEGGSTVASGGSTVASGGPPLPGPPLPGPSPLAPFPPKEEVEAYVELSMRLEELNESVGDALAASPAVSAALTPLRAVLLTRSADGVTAPGLVLRRESRRAGAGAEEVPGAVCLSLHAPAPGELEAAEVREATRREAEEAARREAQARMGQGGLVALKSKGEDDDLMLMGAGSKKKKGGKQREASKGLGTASAVPAAPLPLPCYSALLPEPCEVQFVVDWHPVRTIAGVSSVRLAGIDCEAALVLETSSFLLEAARRLAQLTDGAALPLLDPARDLRLHSLEVAAALKERQTLQGLVSLHPVSRHPARGLLVSAVRGERLVARRLRALQRRLRGEALGALPEFRQRLQVLRRLGYLDADEGVTLKGRVACCFGTGDELVSAELALSGALQALDAAQAAALLSALVFQDRAGGEGDLDGEDALRWGCAAAREAAERVLEAQNAAGMGRGAGFQRSGPLNFGLVGVVKEWARGVPFLELCQLTDVMEGNIVRTITRLDETCREFQNAAHVMGSPALFKLMEAASAAIKRDVVFAASLYVA